MIGAKAKLVSFTFREKTIAVFERSAPLVELYRFSEEASRNSGRECTLIGPELADKLIHSPVRGELVRSSPFATSGMIAYEKGDAPLSHDIVYEDHSGMRVIMQSGQYKGEPSIALFIPCMGPRDFECSGKDIFISVPEERIIPIPAFPETSGWHCAFKETSIPHGEPLEAGTGGYLSRSVNAYVGPVARGYSFDGHGKDYVCVDFAPWYYLGAVFEVK
jgi:hypothetical protein